MFVGGVLAFLFMGLLLGLLGGGGAILTVPILVYIFKQDPLQATSSSLFIVGGSAIIGGLQYFINKQVHLRTVLLFAFPSFAGVFVSRNILLPSLPDLIQVTESVGISKSIVVMTSFAAVMLLASIKMIRPSVSQEKKVIAQEANSARAAFKIVANGMYVGIAAGFVGAGGGFLIMPALTLILGLPMRVAVGSSLMIISIQSILGFLVSSDLGQVDWSFLFTQIAIATVGILIGGVLNKHVEEKKLKTGFGYFVLLMGILIFVDQLLRL